MASAVDICNLALGHLGDEAGVASISPPDGSVQASHCQRFYPIARDALLQSHGWGFALQRQSLALLSTVELPSEWAFAYARPNALRVLGVYPPGAIAGQSQGEIFNQEQLMAMLIMYPFAVETLTSGDQVIFSNVETATALFIRPVTDTAKFTPLFVMALSRLLASMLAGPLIKGKDGIEIGEAHRKLYETIDGPRAKAFDGAEGRNTSYDTFMPSSLKARR
jgi:hypothetical protein